MMQKSSLSNFCLTDARNLKVFIEVHGRDIAFAKSEQSYHLTSTDAETAAVRLLLPLHRVIFHCIHTKKIKSFDSNREGSHEMLISDVCHNYQF